MKPTIHAIGAAVSPSRAEENAGWRFQRGDEVMEEENEGSGGGGQRSRTHIPSHYCWALASTAQFGWAISAYRRGYAGDHRLMPFKAFGVASLFLGASTSAAVASLQAFGIHKVEDLVELGASIRNGLGIPKRARDE